MRKRIITAASAAIAAAVLFALFLPGKSVNRLRYSESTSPKKEIFFACNSSYNEKTSLVYQEMTEKYNAQCDDAVVKLNSLADDDYFDRLKIDFASGNEPDLFVTWPGITVDRLVKRNKVAVLDELFDEDPEWYSSFHKSNWRYVKLDGKICGVPLMKSYAAFFVNTEVLKKTGEKAPANYAELKALIPRLRKHGIVPFAANISNKGLLTYHYISAVLGGSFNSANVTSGGIPNEYYDSAMDYMKELYDMKAFPDNMFEMTDEECSYMFMSGKAAFTVQYSDFMESVYDSEMLDKVEIKPFPAIEGAISLDKAVLYGAATDIVCVAESSMRSPEKRSGVTALLKYLTTKEAALDFVKQIGSIPAINIVPAKARNQNKIYDMNYVFLKSVNEYIDFPHYYIDINVLTHLQDKFPAFLEGSASKSEVWVRAYRYAEGN